MDIVAGRTYRVVDANGRDRGCGAATLTEYDSFKDKWPFQVAGWYLQPDGYVLDGWHVEPVDLPNAGDAPNVAVVSGSTSVEPETTSERHAADEADLGGNLPRLDARRLELRRLHALERIADSLAWLAGDGITVNM